MKTLKDFLEVLPEEHEFVLPSNVNNGSNINRQDLIFLTTLVGEIDNLINNKDVNFDSLSIENKAKLNNVVQYINELSSILGNKRNTVLNDTENFIQEINTLYDAMVESNKFKSLMSKYEEEVFGDFVVDGLEVSTQKSSGIFDNKNVVEFVKEVRTDIQSTWLKQKSNKIYSISNISSSPETVSYVSYIQDVDKVRMKYSPNFDKILNSNKLNFSISNGTFFSNGYYYSIKDTELIFNDTYITDGIESIVASLDFSLIGENENFSMFKVSNNSTEIQHLIETEVSLSFSSGTLNMKTLNITPSVFQATNKTHSTKTIDGVSVDSYTFDALVFIEKFFNRKLDSISGLSGKIILNIDNSNVYCSLEGSDTNFILNIQENIGSWYSIVNDGDLINFNTTTVVDISQVGISINEDVFVLDKTFLSVLDSNISLSNPTPIKYPRIDGIYLDTKFITQSNLYSPTKQYVVGDVVLDNNMIFVLTESVQVGTDTSNSRWVKISDFSPEDIKFGGSRIPIFSYVDGQVRIIDESKFKYEMEEPNVINGSGLLIAKVYRDGSKEPVVRSIDDIKSVSFSDIRTLKSRIEDLQYNISKLNSVLEKVKNEENKFLNLVKLDVSDDSIRDFNLEYRSGLPSCDVYDDILEPFIDWRNNNISLNEKPLTLDVVGTDTIISQELFSGSIFINKYGVQQDPITTFDIYPREKSWIANSIDRFNSLDYTEYEKEKEKILSVESSETSDDYLSESPFEKIEKTTESNTSNVYYYMYYTPIEPTVTTTTMRTFYTGKYRLTKIRKNSVIYMGDDYKIKIKADKFSFDYMENVSIYMNGKYVGKTQSNKDGSINLELSIGYSDFSIRRNNKYKIKLVGENSKITGYQDFELTAYTKTKYFNTSKCVSKSTDDQSITPYDPLAQTFLVDNDFSLDSVEVIFDMVGKSGAKLAENETFKLPENVLTYIVETEAGFPNWEKVVAMKEMKIGTVVNNSQWTKIEFDTKPRLYANKTYAMIFITTATSQGRSSELTKEDFSSKRIMLRVAELNKFTLQSCSVSNVLINEQPYIDGTMLSSSNAITWSPEQTIDIAFKVNKAEFSLSKTYSKSVDIENKNVTDIMFTKNQAFYEVFRSNIDMNIVDSYGNSYIYNESNINSGIPLSSKKDFKSLDVNLTLNTEDQYDTPVEENELGLMTGSVQSSSVFITKNIDFRSSGGKLRISLRTNRDFDPSLCEVYYNTSPIIDDLSWVKIAENSLGFSNLEYFYTDTLDRSYSGRLRLKIVLKVDENSPSIRPNINSVEIYTV